MALPTFHDVLFPEAISYGSSGGPGFNTTVIELASGAEQRNINWSQARAKYDVSHGVKTREQMEELLDFFWARRGKAYGFRFKDWMDYQLPRQTVGVVPANGLLNGLQVYKRYEADTSYYFDRALSRLVPGTVRLWVGGTQWGGDNPSSWIDYSNGNMHGGSFAAGALVEVECEFHVPVRFDIDDINITHDDWELMSWPSIPLVELKGSTL